MERSLSIIIVNYKSWGKLKLCLESISKQNGIKISTIVVDNNSDDNNLLSFKNNYKWVEWVENSKNFGFAKACNIGAKHSKSFWNLFLNPDTILIKNSLLSLINYCSNNSQHKIIGIKQVDKKFLSTNSFGIFLNFWSLSGLIRPIIRLLKKKSYKKINSKSVSHPDWISGSFILIRRLDFDLLNGWSENYWMYYEDMDLCKRAMNNNLKVTLLNDWSCIHFHGGSSRKNKKIKIITKSEVIVSSHVYIEQHTNARFALITHISLIMVQFTNLLISIPFSSAKRAIFLNSISYWLKGILKSDWNSKRAESNY